MSRVSQLFKNGELRYARRIVALQKREATLRVLHGANFREWLNIFDLGELMISTGDPDYDAILERVAELRAEYRLANPQLPAVPPSFTVDLCDSIRMRVQFERVNKMEKV